MFLFRVKQVTFVKGIADLCFLKQTSKPFIIYEPD
jgi:hypothetical protein